MSLRPVLTITQMDAVESIVHERRPSRLRDWTAEQLREMEKIVFMIDASTTKGFITREAIWKKVVAEIMSRTAFPSLGGNNEDRNS